MSVEIEIICEYCGTELYAEKSSYGIKVSPCPVCLNNAEKRAYEKGYDEGKEDK